MLKAFIAAAALALGAAPAQAEIVSRSADGFTLRFHAPAKMDPADFTASVAALPRWWDDDHTFSGSAANLSLALEPGGCWCETLADGATFEHARVRSVSQNLILLDAPLGPLSGKAARAELTIRWSAGERGLTPMWSFEVEGPGTGALTDGVHAVMDAGFKRWVAWLETQART